jgi:O-antigen/teichoic acid export membrane protein
MTHARTLARNSALNVAGQVLPIIVAIVAIPPLVRGLGAERFGILTLAWAAIGYFSLFELGLSRALTQAIAYRLGNGGRGDLPAVAWTALALLFALGIVGAVALASVTPLVITRLLNVPGELQGESMTAFFILAASLPLVVSSVGLRGIMEAHHDFAPATAMRIPLVLFMFLGPLLVLPWSRSLVPAVSMVVVGRVVGWLAHLCYCLWKYPFLENGIVIRARAVKPLLRFGGWTTISNIVSPMMVFLDRFVIGALLPLAAVAHYVTPYEVITKLLVIPVALLGAVFPAFAETFASNRGQMERIYERTLRAVLLVMFPLVLVGVAFAREGLSLWVGSVLPAESALVLKWLAVGVFMNSIAQPPFAALQSAGRPDVIAKLHLLELPFYAAAIVALVRAFGLPGVAMAWTLRVTVDAAALLWLARLRLGLTLTPTRGGAWPVLAMLSAFWTVGLLPGLAARMLFVAIALFVFVPLAWRLMLTDVERDGLRQWIRRPLGGPAPYPEGLV